MRPTITRVAQALATVLGCLATVSLLAFGGTLAIDDSSVNPGGTVSGGGRSSSAQGSIVGSVVGGPTGRMSSDAARLDASPVSIPALTAVLDRSPIETVTALSQTIGARYRGSSGPVTARVYYRLGGQTDYTSADMTAGQQDEATYTFAASQLSLRGLEYYVEIARGSRTTSIGTPANPNAFIVELNNQRLPVTTAKTHRMIGFPFDVSPHSVEDVFLDDLGDAKKTEWRLHRWDPAAELYLEYTDVGDIARGLGYWLITKDAVTVDASGTSAIPETLVDGHRYAALTLEPGWNQISTPFAFRTDWTARIADPGIDPWPQAYISGYNGHESYDTVSVLEPYSGYWLRNSSVQDRLVLLPYEEFEPGSTAHLAPAADNSGWEIHLGVTSANVGDIVNIVGVRDGAADGPDAFDFGEPPQLDRFISLAIVNEHPEHRGALLAGDYRPTGVGPWEFPMLLRGNTGVPVNLSVAIDESLSPDYQILLIDDKASQYYDLRQDTSMVFPSFPHESGDVYRLVIGENVDSILTNLHASTLPKSFALHQNYPNPFNPATTIEFVLPTPTYARLDIINLLGQTVTTLVSSDLTAGLHRVVWNGTDQSANTVPSGVYFYRLTAGSYSDTRKMLLIK